MNLRYAVGVLMDHRDLVRRLAAESAQTSGLCGTGVRRDRAARSRGDADRTHRTTSQERIGSRSRAERGTVTGPGTGGDRTFLREGLAAARRSLE